jgi:hypothetical protein
VRGVVFPALALFSQLTFAGFGKLIPGLGHLLKLVLMRGRCAAGHRSSFFRVLFVFVQFFTRSPADLSCSCDVPARCGGLVANGRFLSDFRFAGRFGLWVQGHSANASNDTTHPVAGV